MDDRLEVREVESADQRADRRHDEVVHQGGDDFTESAADDDTHRHVDDIALHGEVLEVGPEF